MIYLLCGRIGSGKTHLARQMQGTLLSVDEVMLKRYPPYLGDAHDAIARQVQRELLAEALRIDGDVILDWGFWRRSDRDAAKAYFSAHGKPVRLIWIDPPEEELTRRRAYRNANLPENAYYIDENLARKCDSAFEPPIADENALRIENTDTGVTSWESK